MKVFGEISVLPRVEQGWLKASKAVTVVGKQLRLVLCLNATLYGTPDVSGQPISQVHLPSC